MKIATWNVNSVRMREPHIGRWLQRVEPDVLLLQEIKCEQPQFPALSFKALGYDSVVAGQKSYNGVAILSRIPLQVHHIALPGLPADDAQARYLEVSAAGVTIGNLYLPNGNSGGEAGLVYKLAWMDRLADRADALLAADTPFVLAGDYNVCPSDVDYAPGTLPANDALVRPEVRARFRRMLWAGLTDAVRVTTPTGTDLQLLGLPGRAPGSATAACGSTTPCSRPSWPTAWSPRPRTRTSVARSNPPTTCLCSLPLTIEAPPATDTVFCLPRGFRCRRRA